MQVHRMCRAEAAITIQQKKKVEGKSIQWKGNPDAMVQRQEHINILSKAAP